MYQGKRMNSKSSAGMKRKLAVLVSLVLVMSLGLGATVAFLIDNTGDVKNVFTPANVPPEVTESFDGELKSNVKVQNNGNVSAYIRATVVATWQEVKTVDNKEVTTGNIAPTAPVAGTDYAITYNTSEQTTPAGKWTLGADGYYYWSKPVDAEKSTGILITSAEPLVNKDGYRLVIEILAQTVQSVPTGAVTSAWSSGVSSVNGTTLVIKPAG